MAQISASVEPQEDCFDLFTDDLRLHVLSKLDVQQVACRRQIYIPACPPKTPQVATMAAVSKHWHALATGQELWQGLCERDHHTNSNCCPPPVQADWLFTYKRLAAVKSLKEVTWIQPGQVTGDRPPGVEGHGACPWGQHGMLLWGGFGSIFPEQVFALSHTDAGLHWRLLRVTGSCPRLRYGHTLTRVGPEGDMALVMGGMTRGGYGGEVLEVAVLQQIAGSDEELYEWQFPDIQGEEPHARGYHTATASPDGTKV